MKLISLNIWGGKVFEPLKEFIKESSHDTDIFCFQEVFSSSADVKISRGAYANILGDLGKTLYGYRKFFVPMQDGFDNQGPVDFQITYGLATFVKDSIPVDSWDHIFICGERNSAKPDDSTTMPAGMLCMRINKSGQRYVICNIHGFAYPGTKLDTKERLEQSRKVKNFLDRERGGKILCGDFNLMPETRSIKILEENMENLIKKFKIPRTRSKLSPYFGTPLEQKFADYTFVSPDISVTDFQVPDVPISDHLPMILNFSRRDEV